MQKKKTIIVIVALLLLLAGTFWWGGNAPGLRGQSAAPPAPSAAQGAVPHSSAPTRQPSVAPTPTTTSKPAPSSTPAPTIAPLPTPTPPAALPKPSATAQMVIAADTGKDKYLTDPVPQGKPSPVEPEEVKVGDTAQTCTLSIRCDTILEHLDWLDPQKVELVPEDGVILATATVTFYEGESVFNLLQRETKRNKIHMEYMNTPIYNSAYIEGIYNLYEFDCGELSGWMYAVNGWFPNYGCSRYQLKQDDVVEWVYTCDLGADVGGHANQGGKT